MTGKSAKSKQTIDANGSADRMAFGFRWRYAVIIFIIALTFRAIYLLEAGKRPDFYLFSMDQQYNLEWAKCIVSGNWPAPYDRLQNAAFFRAPLYSYSMAGVFLLFGQSPLLICVLQILIGSISCVLAYAVGARCFGQAVGLITGLFCAVYWILAYFDVEFLMTVPLVFFALLGFLLVFIAVERRSPGFAGAGGLAFGLFGITRADILLFYPALMLWALAPTWQMGKKKAAWFLALLAIGCALPVAFVTLRNRIVSGDWVVVAAQGGVNFYIGNNPESNGMQAIVPHTRATWWGGYEDAIAIAEKDTGRKLTASGVSNYWYGRAFEFIRQEPGRWARLTIKKTIAFFGSVEVPNNDPYESKQGEFALFRLVPLNFGVFFGLFLVSLPAMLWPRRLAVIRGAAVGGMQQGFARLVILFIAVYSATMTSFFVTGRFRVPLIPFVAIGAALAVAMIVNLIRDRRVVVAIGMAATALILVLLLNVDVFNIRSATRAWVEFSEAQKKMSTGDIDGAISTLEKIRSGRSMEIPEVYTSLARAYVLRGRPADLKAILEVAEDGLSRHPDTPELFWYAATVNMENRKWNRASELVERYLASSPNDMQALRLAFFAALNDGRPQDAARHLAAAEGIDNKSPLVAGMRKAMEHGK
jgi:4-amino-4-deoxy-L-arabinose transferase-like glycosyltransferase